jgi:hypothetical protein
MRRQTLEESDMDGKPRICRKIVSYRFEILKTLGNICLI